MNQNSKEVGRGLRYTEAELIEGLDPYTAHADELPGITAEEFDTMAEARSPDRPAPGSQTSIIKDGE